jgi:PKD repeat protein
VTLDVRHVTIPAVAKYGVLVDAAQAQVLLGAGVGNITTTITGSIVHGTAGSLARNYNGAALNIGANKVIVKYANSDASAMKDESQPLVGPVVSGDKNYGPNIDMGSPQLNTDAQLMDERFRLRAGSAAIDKGGAIVGDESATDIDGDPRTAGGATDIGADEFTNRAPVAKGVTLDPAQPKSGQPVTITGDATDPNVGDPLQFGFDFGDGSARVTSPTAAVQHVYARPGTYTLQFAAVDAAGLFSELITKSVTVIDGTPPSVAITGRKLLVKRHELRIRGTASDESGVASVEIALTRSAGCRQYTGRGFVRGGKGKACAASRKWIPVQLIGGKWEITTNPDVKLNKGKYVVRARGTDTAGSVGTRFSTKARTLVRVAVK